MTVDNEVVSKPSVKNGILIFDNDKSFRYYEKATNTANTNTALQRSPVISNSPAVRGFISMKDAFTSLIEDDARIGDSIETNDPNASAETYDATHTYLTGVYPNSFYVSGNSTDGYYYEINCFDRAFSTCINHNGLVKIGKDLYQFTKDYYKIWLDGDINNTTPISSATQSNGRDMFVVDIRNPNTRLADPSDSASMITAYDALRQAPNSIFLTSWNRSCQNTKRISGRNRRVIGYVDWALLFRPYRISTRPLRYRLELSVEYNTLSRSLKGRLFGAWYDNWNTAHHQDGNINSPSINGFGGFGNAAATIPITTNWGYYDAIKNNVSDFNLYFPAYDMNVPESNPDYDWTVYIFPNAPFVTSHYAHFTALAGMVYPNDNPNCSCNYPQ